MKNVYLPMKTGKQYSINPSSLFGIGLMIIILSFILLDAGKWHYLRADPNLFFSLAFSCFVSIIAIIRSLRERTVAAWIDGKSFCFLFGASILYLWLWNFRPEIIRETYACMLLFILCTSVSNESLDTKHLTQAILGSSILFSLYGLAQRCGFFASPTAYFPMTGSFDNPAGLGMFLAISFPYALSQYQYGWTNRLIVFLIGLTLLLTESRTSILAAAVAATIYFSHKLSSRWQRALLLSIGLLFVGLYFYKPLSANGRLFISYITARLVHGHFLTGNGPFSFETEYMMEQARYFVAHPTSSYIQLADNITQPFNEYLHLFIRFGFMGLVLLSAIAWMTYQKMRTCATRLKQAAWASLCAGAVCACFSYPCHYPAIWVLLILSLSNIYTPTVSQGHAAIRYKAFSVLAIAFCVLSLSIIQARYEQQRISLEERAANGEDSASLQDSYNLLYDRSYFRIHPAFLYNYAIYLFEREQYAECLSILEQSEAYKIDYNRQILKAYTLQHLGKIKLAIEAFQLASHMLPGRLQPHYELINLYELTGQHRLAVLCAQNALKLPLKVKNARTLYFQKEIQKFLIHSQTTKHKHTNP